jgi:hypothetical protein
MALSDYACESAETYLDDNTGVIRRVLVLAIPEDSLNSERSAFQASTSNRYPGENSSDIYAHCILRSTAVPFPNRPGEWKVTCHYGPPTKQMLLQPGRGVPSLKTASEMRPVWTGRKFVSGMSPTSPVENRSIDAVMWQTVFRKGKQAQLFPIPVIVVDAADYALKEREIFNEAIDWYGKTGELAYFPITAEGDGNRAMFFGGGIGRKPDDASVILIRYVFQLDMEDSWQFEFQDLVKRFPFQEMPTGQWQPFAPPESGTISRGTATFTRVDDYLSWLG